MPASRWPAGSLEAAYARRFADYKQADVKTLIRIPKAPDRLRSRGAASTGAEIRTVRPEPDRDRRRSGPQARGHRRNPRSRQRLRSRRRGHQARRASRVGQPLASRRRCAQIEQRLKASGHFETVEIRKRYRSLESTSDVALVLLVHERPGFTSETIDERPADVGLDARQEPTDVPADRRLRRRLWLHVWRTGQHDRSARRGRAALGAADLGRHAPRGGRSSSARSRSGPLTRVAIDLRHLAAREPALRDRRSARRVDGARRTQLRRPRPRRRRDVAKHGDVRPDSTIGCGRSARTSRSTRAAIPRFPRNAVLLGAGWTGLHVRQPRPSRINRYTTDARGYLGVIRQAVLAGRVQYSTADRTLPPTTSGCCSAARRTCAASAPGRSTAIACSSRQPSCACRSRRCSAAPSSALTAFMDAGKTFDVGQSLKDAAWHHGVGGGVFLIATIVRSTSTSRTD